MPKHTNTHVLNAQAPCNISTEHSAALHNADIALHTTHILVLCRYRALECSAILASVRSSIENRYDYKPNAKYGPVKIN